MANDEKRLKIVSSPWTEKANGLIAQAVRPLSLVNVRRQVEDGQAQLFQVMDGKKVVGAFILRVDKTATGCEGVIVAGAGQCDGVDMINTCMPAIEKMFIGCDRIRYHTEKPALARKLSAMGYSGGELVCFKELSHGR